MDNPIKYSDLVRPDSSITDLIEQLKELGRVYDAEKAKIVQSAQEQKAAIRGVGGATEEQRKQIEQSMEQSDKLVKEYRDLSSEIWLERERLVALNAAKKESNQIDKLVSQIQNSVEGSYNRLSAQYRLNKIRLNALSAEQRSATVEGRKLEAETHAIYEEMKRLQEATGKHQLSVGDYSIATKGLRQQVMELTQEMVQMRMEGRENTAEYAKIAQRAAELKDAFMDAQAEVKNMASDTSALNSVMSGITAAGGGFTALTGAMTLFGGKSEDVQEAQKKLQATIAITNGLTAVQNALQHQSALMLGVSKVQMMALAKAEAYERLIKIKGTEATVGATVAQKAFNLVAKANPYILLATALISVVGALFLFTSGADKAVKKQTELNNVMERGLELQEKYVTYLNEGAIKVQNNIQIEIDIMKAQGASVDEIRKKEDELLQFRSMAFNRRRGYFAEELNQLGLNKAAVISLTDDLLKLEKAKAEGAKKAYNITVDGKTVSKMDIDKAIDYIQSQINLTNRKIQIGTELQVEGDDIAAERARLEAQRKREDQQRAKAERDTVASTMMMRLSLLRDGYERERKQAEAQYTKQIADLRYRLQTETDLTLTARAALYEQIDILVQQSNRRQEEIFYAHQAKVLALTRELEDLRLAAMAEGDDKERRELEVSYARRIEDLQTRLRTETNLSVDETNALYAQIEQLGENYRVERERLEARIQEGILSAQEKGIALQLEAVQEGSDEEIDLTVKRLNKQREIELAQNAQLAQDRRQSTEAINKKYDTLVMKATYDLAKKRAEAVLNSQQELEQTELELMNANARKKEQLSIKQEIARLKLILELNKTSARRLTETEINGILATIKALEQKAKSMSYNNMFELLGININDEQQSALNTALGSVQDSINSIMDSYDQLAQKAVQAADKQVDAAKAVLDAQLEARANGYANDVETAQKEYELAKRNQERALRQQQKMQRAQMLLDSATQASSLTTATANIWKSFSSLGPFGVGAAIAAIATMWGSFAAAKVKALQVTRANEKSEEYGEGTVELLQGGSHASGHDIDLGTKPDGTRRRAEGGEFFAVINKRNSKRFRNVIPDVIRSFNDGSFAEKYGGASVTLAGANISRLEGDVHAIRKQGETQRNIEQGAIVIQYKNLTRKLIN